MAFESPDYPLDDLLGSVRVGKIQLPDFQREFKWEDERIASLLATVSRGYPIGVVMTVETGGEGSRFKWRPLAGVDQVRVGPPEMLLLDGQQRLTSLYQVMLSASPVATKDARGKDLSRWFYIDIAEALGDESNREEAILAVPEDRILREDFGRRVVADYSSRSKEVEAGVFPLSIVFDADEREEWMMEFVASAPERAQVWRDFRASVLHNITRYMVPVIKLTRETPKEAVCVVFEKVNTGGVQLNVFELLTATFAGDRDYYAEHGQDFELNTDWRSIKRRLDKQPVLHRIASTDFLQAVTLLSTRKRRMAALDAGVQGVRPPAISAKRGDILRLKLSDYVEWRDPLVEAFEWTAQFLSRQRVFRSGDLPYTSQVVPLAVLKVILGRRATEHPVDEKLTRWYWSGVLGELYGGTTETRFARDVEQVPDWIDGGPEPDTVTQASFHENRLLTLRTRGSAAYKGIYALLMRRGCVDWIHNQPLDLATFYNLNVDIHHVFPVKWCNDNHIDAGLRESVVNKTAIAYDTNRAIGGRSPADYLPFIEARANVDPGTLDRMVETHMIDAATLRVADFTRYFAERKELLLVLVSEAMGKDAIRAIEVPNAEQVTEFESSPDEEDPADVAL